MHDERLLREDDAARERALDTRGSFLVQAPAGSGKTELLIQRFLALLATVDEPERILALTFTRKAAGEMRERVLAALVAAHEHAPVAAGRPHEAVTRRLASAALAQDAARGWSLVHHPARLRILTFDALTTWLVRNAPFAARLGPAPGYADDARGLYDAAAVAAIARAGADDPSWRRLLVHLHNDADRAATLLAKLLARRGQFLRQVRGGDVDAVRAALVAALAEEVDAALAALRELLPADLAPELPRLAACAANELAGEPKHAELAAGLARCGACAGLPPFTADGLPLWRTLAAWLLTKNGTLRERVDKGCGFPAGKDAARTAAKRGMEALLARLRGVPQFALALAHAASMPSPAAPAGQAWEVIEAVLRVVPRVAAQLSVTFQEHGEVDFAEAAQAALRALGEADAPSELLQRLDDRIAHLLVDEFQDTSVTQLDLLARLTAGWTPGEDGRTIFAVGDPMQSIYRFREAEVRLFVEAKRGAAVAGVPVACLTLRRNFRSQARIVDWVNTRFPVVLGSVDDPTRGAVAFEPATAARPALPDADVTLELCPDARGEALAVVARVRAALARGSGDVAILVRSRNHLDAILPALREAGIAFAAVELDRLGQRQAVQDLLSLTHALLQPGDRLAWLAVLRAPWCGLAFADLLAIAARASPTVPIVTVLDDPALPALLTPDGRARLARVQATLAAACASHGRGGVAERVRGAWLALGGPACLADAIDLESAQRYFDVLAAHERAGDVPEWSVLCAALDELYAAPDAAAATPVRVMTMHKAKGLQFDTVVLPGLGRKGPPASHELLRWRSRAHGLLIAPSRSPGDAVDPLYEHLGRIDREEESAELARVLYVACTRARSRLHLVGAPPAKADKDGNVAWRPPAGSSLAKLWPAVQDLAPPAVAGPPAVAHERPAPPLVRLPATLAVARAGDGLRPDAVTPAAAARDIPFDWAQERARVVGTLAHRLLARLAGDAAWDEARVGAFAPRVRADLASAGFADDEVEPAAQRVLDAVRRTLRDERGRWLFDASHEDARSEWAIAGVDGGDVVHAVVDRTFVAGGERWVVDFKTGTHEGGDVAGFLASEVERYRDQLARYGRLLRALDPRPVRLALYYPLVDGGFREI